jgi:two-component system, NarL family, response regulator DevR
MRTKVLVVDDHDVVRQGVRALIDSQDDMLVVGEAADAEEALEVARRTAPEVVIMDVRLEASSGIEACRGIRDALPDTKVIMLTSFADEDALFASIMAGASGFVLKQVKGDDVVRAVRQVAAGQSLLDPAMTGRVLDRLRQHKDILRDEKLSRLTAQEERILTMIADGKTNGEIGAEIHLAEKTIKNYVSSILTKLEVARRAEAAAYLVRHERDES